MIPATKGWLRNSTAKSVDEAIEYLTKWGALKPAYQRTTLFKTNHLESIKHSSKRRKQVERKLKIISADERMSQDKGVKALIVGPAGVGKTTLLRTLDPKSTLFVDLEAGDSVRPGCQG
jgi:polynucleotide 5'-kinase involved in rRNA processing